MILLDTHVFVWLAEDSAKLGPKARRRIAREGERRRLHVSAVTFWELEMLVQAKRLRLARDLGEVRCAVLYEKPRSEVHCEYVWRRTDRWIDFPWSAEPPIPERLAGSAWSAGA